MLIKTERTTIKPITLEDAPFMLELTNTPGWLKYIGDRNIHSVSDAENYLSKSYFSSLKSFGFTYYLISLHDKTPIGICGFLKKDYLENPDFGFAFMPEYHGKGYGFEAGKVVLDYGMNELNLSKVDAITVPENIASIKLLEKLGFDLVGTIKEPKTNDELNYFHKNSAR